jgi:hypothetical protein
MDKDETVFDGLRERIVGMSNQFVSLAFKMINTGKDGDSALVPDAMAGALSWIIIKQFYPDLPEEKEAKLFLELKDLAMDVLFTRVAKDVPGMKRLMIQHTDKEKR